MSRVGRLMATLGLDSRGFKKGLQESEGRVKRFGKTMTKIGAGMSVVSAGVMAAIRGQLNAADDLSKSAQRLGVPIGELAALRHAADMSAVGVGDLDNGIIRLSRNMNDAQNGVKKSSDLFKDLGISVTDGSGALRPASDVMADAAEKLAAMPDGAKKTAVAFELFGRAGAKLIPMLNGGSDGLKAMLQEAEDLGLVIDQKTGKAAENFNDNLSRLGKTVQGIMLQATAALAPVLERVTNAVVSASTWFRNLSPSVRQAIAAFAGFLAIAGPVALGIGALTLALSAVAGPVIAVVAGFGAIVAVSSGLGVSLRTIASVAGAVAAAFGIKLAVAVGTKYVASAIAATRQAVALEVALGAKTRAAALAGVAVKGLSRGLRVLRSALVSTGIGALVVAAGLLVDQFIKLVQRAGGLGNALSLLWGVAKEAFDRIGLFGWAAMSKIEASFLSFRAAAVRIFAKVVGTVIDAAEGIVDAGLGAAAAFKASFKSIPGALGDFMFQGVNAVIRGVESMINAVTKRIDKFIGKMNNALAKLPAWAGGGSLEIGTLGEVKLPTVPNPFKGKAEAASTAAIDAYQKQQGQTDFGSPSAELDAVAAKIDLSAAAARSAAKAALSMATEPLSSLDKLREAMAGTGDEVDETSTSVTNLQNELDNLGADGGGGGAGGKAGKGAKGKSLKEKLSGPFKYLKDQVKGFSDSIAGAIVQGKGLGDAMRGVFQKMAQDLISSGIQTMLLKLFNFGGGGGGGGGFFGTLLGTIFKIPGKARGTNYFEGGLAQVFEEGGELVNLPTGAQVIPHDLSKRMMDAAGRGARNLSSGGLSDVATQSVVISLAQSSMTLTDNGEITAKIGVTTDQKISRAAQQADRALPDKIQRFNNNPRDRY